MTNFNDIFKSSFLQNATSFSLIDCLIALILAFILGLFIAYVYKKTYGGVIYSPTFALTLLGLCLVTTFVIVAVTSNVVLSLGMVGALSIVRFRTAIKDPIDIVFLFWSIATGIVIGAGMIPLAVIGCLMLGIIFVTFANKKPSTIPYILVIRYNFNDENKILKIVNQHTSKYKIKNQTLTDDYHEIIIEVRLNGTDSQITTDLAKLDNVNSISLINYDGNYMD